MTSTIIAPRGSVLQFEVDTKRFVQTEQDGSFHQGSKAYGSNATPWGRLYAMARTAACDTMYNGGTFVLVMDKASGKLTMIQRPDAEPL